MGDVSFRRNSRSGYSLHAYLLGRLGNVDLSDNGPAVTGANGADPRGSCHLLLFWKILIFVPHFIRWETLTYEEPDGL